MSQLPSINFLVYLPRRTEYPLYIVDPVNTRNLQKGFLVPQWGGVVICNALPETSGTGPAHFSVEMEELMPIFIQQLTALLGVPSKVRSGTRGMQCGG